MEGRVEVEGSGVEGSSRVKMKWRPLAVLDLFKGGLRVVKIRKFPTDIRMSLVLQGG